MQHDEHFLSRLARLDHEHAEIALGLYFDSTLVKTILYLAGIPDEAERVALCLGSPEQGPFIIVARDGHFVTCLGEGMRLQEGQPLISRHRLDTISETVNSLRTLVGDAKAGNRVQTQRRLERVFTAGPGMSQQEFEDIARWLPLLDVTFLRTHMDTTEHIRLLFEHLSRKKLRRRDDVLLHDYWKSTWAVAHLTMLLGSDGGATLRRLLGEIGGDEPASTALLPWCLVRLGVASFAARGTWIASKLPAITVPMAKGRYLDEQASFLTTLTDGLSLAAIGLRHRKYQAEIRKAITKGTPREHDEPSTIGLLRKYCSLFFEHHSKDPDTYRQHTVHIARTLLSEVYRRYPARAREPIEEVSDDAAVALLLSIPHGVHGDVAVPRSLFERLPWIVSVEAKAFYMPEPAIGWLRTPWTRRDGELLLEARLEGGVYRPQPIVAAPKIGRNEPCPCGSGKKHKRCCGGPGQPAAA
jgi:hypothetical protein